ncbi:MAG TPA: M20/M25/M40 family metallo-hydrolase [Anaerolineae bacterium]|nr:M20/M25/M40 family metallo-hydrolase [Anaerolineae bacterium]
MPHADTLAALTQQYLRDLVRIDTTNPPGNEKAAADYIAGVLRAAGVPSKVLESAPGRASVIARLKGDGSLRPLLLLSHLDVVPADPTEWDQPPFAANVVDGYMFGRGTVDTKNLTAVELALMVTLQREGVPLKRDLILAATADEEAGGEMGMNWLLEHHSAELEAEYCINEGGGDGVMLGGRRFYTCQTGEKGVCWMKVTAHGTPGHASMPRADNAVVRLCAAVARAGTAKLPLRKTDTVERLVEAAAALLPAPLAEALRGVLDPAREEEALQLMDGLPQIQALLRATLHDTISPTMLEAGSKANVIPGTATATLDGRIVPGQTPDAFLAEVQELLGPEVKAELLQRSTGHESEPGSPLFDLMAQVLREHDPGSVLAPFLVPGATDGRMLAARGVKVYGFCPLQDEPGWPALEMAHARNERISLANLRFSSAVLYDVVRRFCC